MNVLIINSRFRNSDHHFPIGLGYIASACIKAGHKIEFVDLNLTQDINSGPIDLICIGGMITGYSFAKQLTITLKNSLPQNIPIIVGGSLVMGIEETFLANSMADIAVVGEGEQTIVELLDYLEKNKNVLEVKGLVVKHQNKIYRTEKRPFCQDVDSLALPAWDIFNMEDYFHPYSVYFGKERATDIIASRGCPFGCTFCSHAMGRKVRFRSPGKVLDEIQNLYEKYNVKGFVFCDETFSVNKKWAKKICDGINDRNLDIKWVCYSRADSVDDKMLEIMKKAGCIGVSYGFESGCQKVLDQIKKGTTVEQNINAIKLTKKHRMNVGGNFIVGFPGETKKTIRETYDFIRNNTPDVWGIYFPLPLPASELWDQAVKMGIIQNVDQYLSNIPSGFSLPYVNLTDIPLEEIIEMHKKFLENK